ncbi:MAG: hypothetical protein GY870_11875 [archaeon]|nr:hypothetical protein [archaeon]
MKKDMLLKTLLKNLIANLNSLIWKPHTTTDIICWWWYKALDENDLRYLLKKKRKLIPYPQGKFMAAFDKLYPEYERLIMDNSITEHLRDLNYDIGKKEEILILKGCYDLMILNDERAIIHLSYLGINIKEINKETILLVNNTIKAFKTKEKIRQIKEKENKPTEEKQSFESRVIDINYFLNLGDHIDPKKITLSAWCKWVNKAKEKKEYIEKQNTRHGKTA